MAGMEMGIGIVVLSVSLARCTLKDLEIKRLYIEWSLA
ncbi:unnamed protein product [Penicillium camemberti]|uniref:Str. FM013 n=1 Tax=Penicillium camemberti (strain FM 013) TaxID=1429867 RepID=A0A0G4NWJ7_PENC3|nr:unnamed protein product [Penicillium camemberti]